MLLVPVSPSAVGSKERGEGDGGGVELRRRLWGSARVRCSTTAQRSSASEQSAEAREFCRHAFTTAPDPQSFAVCLLSERCAAPHSGPAHGRPRCRHRGCPAAGRRPRGWPTAMTCMACMSWHPSRGRARGVHRTRVSLRTGSSTRARRQRRGRQILGAAASMSGRQSMAS